MLQIGKKYSIYRKLTNSNKDKCKKKVITGTLVYQNRHYYVFRIDGIGGSYNTTFSKAEERIGDITIKPR